MFKKSFLISVFFLPLLSFTSAKASSPGDIRDRIGNYNGSIDSRGVVQDRSGNITESIDSAGKIWDRIGNYKGSIDSRGVVQDRNGNILGSVDSAGKILDRIGNYEGKLDSSGRVSTLTNVIGFVPSGDRYLAFEMMQRHNQQQAQRSQNNQQSAQQEAQRYRYAQQLAQQRNAEIEAQNKAIQTENCKEIYRLYRPPYSQYIASVVLRKSCSNVYEDVALYCEPHFQELHRKDCDAKRLLCLQKANQPFCRPYWTYCADYDAEQRKNQPQTRIDLPAPATKMNFAKKEHYVPCNGEGRLFLFDENIQILGAVKVTADGTLWHAKHRNKNSLKYAIGQINERGRITPNKHILSRDKAMLKKTYTVGKVASDGIVGGCGLEDYPFVFGFYDTSGVILPPSGKYPKDTHFLLRDTLNDAPPAFVAAVQGDF